MHPNNIIKIKNIPLTLNGKVDYGKLPEPDWENQNNEILFEKPKTEMEKNIARIWRKLLDIPRIGVYDSFFNLGGNSLLLMRSVAEINDLYNDIVSVKEHFQNPTLISLAQILEKKLMTKNQKKDQFSKRIRKSGISKFFLSNSQEQMWTIEQLSKREKGIYNIPLIHKLIGKIDINGLKYSLDSVVRRHSILRTTYKAGGEGVIQEIQNTPEFEWVMIDCSEKVNAQVENVINEIIYRPFDLSKDQPIRAALLKLKDNEHIWVIVIHHIACDGLSSRIILNEISTIYNTKDKGCSLDPVKFQYIDFSVWQHEPFIDKREDQLITFWKNYLAEAPERINLPLDYQRPEVQEFKGGQIEFSIKKKTLTRFRELAKQEGITLFLVFLAAYYILLYRFTQQSEILIGTPVANRTRKEFENTVGYFVNTVIFRAHILETDTVKDLIQKLKKDAGEIYSNQELSTNKIVEVINPQRSLAYSPLFQVMFTFENFQLSKKLDLDNLETVELKFENKIAKFDLTLSIVEKENELKGYLEYDSELFKLETVVQLSKVYTTILDEF